MNLRGKQHPQFVGRCIYEGAGRYVWRIYRPFSFWTSDGRVISIPEGFPTDMASVPRWLWWAVPLTDGQYDAAAVVHDYAVRNRTLLLLSLYDCHQIFYEALVARGVPEWKCIAMYRAVLAFNWMSPGPGDGSTPKSILRRLAKAPAEAYTSANAHHHHRPEPD